MRIAYVTIYDPRDVRQWSGSGHYIARALSEAGLEVDAVGPLRDRFGWWVLAKHAFYRKVLQRSYARDREPVLVRGYTRQIERRLAERPADVILSPQTGALWYLESKTPQVIWNDAPLAGMLDFYPNFKELCRESRENGLACERAVYQRCRLAVFTSDWAARSAIDHYGLEPAKVKVVPFGANLSRGPSAEEVEGMIDQRGGEVCRLLFMGVDWERKGGDVALKVAEQLNHRGVKTELIVAGCEPPSPRPAFVRAVGFLSKDTAEGEKALNELLGSSHFLILPSRAEAYGLVFCEASAFGLPSLATNVGGIPTIIHDGANGRTFALEASADEYCDYVQGLMADWAAYRRLCLASRGEYDARLNWTAAGRAMRGLLEQVVGGKVRGG